MSDEACACCGSTDEPTADRPTGADRWLDDRPVTDAPLPPDVASEMTRFYEAGPVETLGDFVAATRAGTGGGAIAVEDLCHVDGETPHRAETPAETYQFRCFYDGVALAHLCDEPAEIRTESPAGETIELRVTPDGDVDATPPETAISFGIAADVDVPADGPAPADVYEAVCPYVKAFPSREHYEAWAAGVDAATVGMALAAGVPVAAALAE